MPGETYFFTVNLVDRTSDLLTRHVPDLRNAVQSVRASAPFLIDAWVVLPEHMHCIWTLPEGDADFSSRWRRSKASFSVSRPGGEHRSASRVGKDERGIWQRRFWEHTIRDDRHFAAHVDDVHFNPVKHGLVTDVPDWPCSSFHCDIARGLNPASWARGSVDVLDAGERS